jgi:hypothetical protein
VRLDGTAFLGVPALVVHPALSVVPPAPHGGPALDEDDPARPLQRRVPVRELVAQNQRGVWQGCRSFVPLLLDRRPRSRKATKVCACRPPRPDNVVPPPVSSPIPTLTTVVVVNVVLTSCCRAIPTLSGIGG